MDNENVSVARYMLDNENVSIARYMLDNENVSVAHYMLVTADNELATCGISSISQLCDHLEGDRSGG
jgi:hypothetical protein